MIGLPELRWGATIAAESATATGNMADKPKKRPRKVSDAPDKKETRSLEEGLLLKNEMKVIDGEDKHG